MGSEQLMAEAMTADFDLEEWRQQAVLWRREAERLGAVPTWLGVTCVSTIAAGVTTESDDIGEVAATSWAIYDEIVRIGDERRKAAEVTS